MVLRGICQLEKPWEELVLALHPNTTPNRRKKTKMSARRSLDLTGRPIFGKKLFRDLLFRDGDRDSTKRREKGRTIGQG